MTVAPFESSLDLHDDFDDIEDASSSKYPKMQGLHGRLLLCKIIKIDENALKYRAKNGETQPKGYVDIVVLDGGPLGDQELPVELDQMWIQYEAFLNSLRPSFKRGTRVLGRLRRYPGKEKMAMYPTPDLIEAAFDRGEVDSQDTCWRLDPATPEDKEIYRRYRASKVESPFS